MKTIYMAQGNTVNVFWDKTGGGKFTLKMNGLEIVMSLEEANALETKLDMALESFLRATTGGGK